MPGLQALQPRTASGSAAATSIGHDHDEPGFTGSQAVPSATRTTAVEGARLVAAATTAAGTRAEAQTSPGRAAVGAWGAAW